MTYHADLYLTHQFHLQYHHALLVLLAGLVSLIVLPADGLVALLAGDVADDVAAGGHAALGGLAGLEVHHAVEQVRLPVLTAEIL